jgi:predicted metal-dependent enzyme (double-stranded beta helix superfamily)
MFDVDDLVVACRAAAADPEPRLAIRDVLERAVSDPRAIADALPPSRAEMVPLHVSPEVTVLKLVWAPGMTLGPHDHRMWAAIGLYSGGEENRFYRRHGDGVDDSGGRSLHPKDVYGGDFFTTPRSEWTGDPLREGPFRVDRVLDLFEAANAELR